MSSESEEDFQSADEGSDLEESESPRTQESAIAPSVKPEVTYSSEDEEDQEKDFKGDGRKAANKSASKESLPEPCDLKPRVLDEAKEETSLMGALKNLSLQVNEQLTLPKNVPDPVGNVSEEEESEESNDSEEEESPECKFKTFSGGLVDDRKYEEKDDKEEVTEPQPVQDSGDLAKADQVENVQESLSKISALDADNQMSEESTEPVQVCAVEDKKDVFKEEHEKDIPSNKGSNKGKQEKEPVCSEENKIRERETPVQESKPEEEVSDVKVQETVPQKKVDIEKKTEGVHPTSQKPKPIRESKIGMKKPREKLGERLGARKLGARIEKKPMEGISSEKTLKSKDPPVSESKSQTYTNSEQDRLPSKGREDEKRLQESSLDKETERWQQVHNIGGKGKMDGFGNKDSDDGWGSSWGNWGTSLISAASTLSQEVGRGVGTILDTVEGTLGVPDPETMAREIAERQKEFQKEAKTQEHQPIDKEVAKTQDQSVMEGEGYADKNDPTEEENTTGGGSVRDYGLGGLSSLGSLVSGVSGVFETASNKVLMGGLDTLEVIGRKAMDAIQDGDPGLRKKRAFLTNAKPNLASALQEARQRAAEEEREQREGVPGKGGKSSQIVRPTLDQAWDSTEGCVHIEALSLVGRQCEIKMSSMMLNIPHYLVERIQAANTEIRSLCELEEESTLEEDFICRVEGIMPLLGLPLQSQKINNAWTSLEETVSLIKEAGVVDGPTAERELYVALAALVAQLAAVLHKGAELALITPEVDPIDVAVQFRDLSCAVCGGIESIADQVCSIITTETSAANPQVNNTITNIYLQSAGGNSYIQQSMTYLASVLQYANTKQMSAEM